MNRFRILSLMLAVLLLFSAFTVVSCDGNKSKYDEAVALYEEGKYDEAKEAFDALGDYKDSKSRIKKCEDAVQDQTYNEALALLDEGKIVEGYELLTALNGYKDSADKASAVYDRYKAEKLKNAKVGDEVLFGAYEQDNDEENGKEEIQWLVKDVKDGKILLVSKYILDIQKNESSGWASSELRNWLNTTFFEAAFSSEDATKILETVLEAEVPTNTFPVAPGGPSKDRLFLLSAQEANNYFRTQKKCEMTPYAKSKSSQPDAESNIGEWWTRSVTNPETRQNRHFIVNVDGGIAYKGILGRSYFGIRPALWLDINA